MNARLDCWYDTMTGVTNELPRTLHIFRLGIWWAWRTHEITTDFNLLLNFQVSCFILHAGTQGSRTTDFELKNTECINCHNLDCQLVESLIVLTSKISSAYLLHSRRWSTEPLLRRSLLRQNSIGGFQGFLLFYREKVAVCTMFISGRL